MSLNNLIIIRLKKFGFILVLVKVSSDINDVKKSDKIVLPGQGSFRACKSGIDNIKGLQEELNESVLVKKKPIYGICAGMQLFATTGHEEEKTSGFFK